MARSLLDPDGYYALLDVDVSVSHDQLTDAYRRQLLQWHPDRSDSPDAAQMTRDIIVAGVVLLDPQRRQDYDTRARQAAGYTHEPPPHTHRQSTARSGATASNRSLLPVLYRASTQAVARFVPEWRRGAQIMCWAAIVGYTLILTDNVSTFNPGFYDLSDGVDQIRGGGAGAAGALRWLIFWSAMALACIIMMLKTRFFRHGSKTMGALTAVSVLPGAFVAVFSAIPIVAFVVILLVLILIAVRILGG